jgi:hypothetical protein
VAQLNADVEVGELAVRSLAGELPNVPLPLAAEITVLLLDQEPQSYASAARRLLARVAEEREMPLVSSRTLPRSWRSSRPIPRRWTRARSLCQPFGELRRSAALHGKRRSGPGARGTTLEVGLAPPSSVEVHYGDAGSRRDRP